MIKVLDCTFRDGGYYNNWKFNDFLVEQYIKALIESKVDIVEIGFRLLPTNRDLGDLASVSYTHLTLPTIYSV